MVGFLGAHITSESRIIIPDLLDISNLRISRDESWWPQTCLAEVWTSKESTLRSTTTCLKIQTHTCIGSVQFMWQWLILSNKAKSWAVNGFTWTALTFLIPSGCESRQVWNERSGHHLCVRWDWRTHFERCSGQVWGEHLRTSRGDWHLVVQWVLIFHLYRLVLKG